MKGRSKCRILKQIRQRIADENDIPYVTRECSYQGECRGTCPRCEAELRYLERELEKRRALGKTVAVAAVAAGLSLTLAGCIPKSAGSSPGGETTQTRAVTEAPPDQIAGRIETVPNGTEPSREPLEGEPEVPQTTAAELPEELEGDVAWIPDSAGPEEGDNG